MKSNNHIERRSSSLTAAEFSSMPGISITKAIPKKRASVSKQLVPVPKPIAIPPAIEFPTPATPIRRLFRTPITVTAGPSGEARPFPIHLEILLTCSPFFAAAYNPRYNFSDSPSSSSTASPNNNSNYNNNNYNNLALPTVNPCDFEFFIQWLYTRTLDHEDLTGPHPAYFKLIRLYGLADQLQVTALKNKIVDEMAVVADRTNSCPTPDDTRVVWDDESGCGNGDRPSRRTCVRVAESTAAASGSDGDGEETTTGGVSPPAVGGGGEWGGGQEGGLRELIGDLFVWKKTDRLVAEHVDQWDERFLREVVVKLKREKARGDKVPWREKGRACRRYHFHDEWAPACEGGVKGE